MFQFIHAADIHLDSPLRGLERYEGAPAAEIRLATRRAFENLVELAIARKVAFVIIAGDLFDGDWKDYNTGHYFVSQMTRLRKAEIPVYIVKGNHDASNKMTRSLPMPANVHIFSDLRPETLVVEDLNVAVHGQSFTAAKVTNNLAAGYPEPTPGYFNIGILHTSATGRDGHEPYAPCSTQDLIGKGYDYWALGHVHKREIVCNDPLIIFPGNVQGRHAKELGPKGCTLVTVDDSLRASQTFEELGVLNWEHCKVNLTGSNTEEEVLDKISCAVWHLVAANAGKFLALRIELNGQCNADSGIRARTEHYINQMRALITDCAGEQLWLEKVIVETRPEPVAENITLDGPLGELVLLIKEMREDPSELLTLQAELSALDKKLPLEVKELIGWSAANFFDDILLDAEGILLDQLAAGEKQR